MEEVKIAWRYNPADGNKLIGSKAVSQDYKLSDGETFVAPGNGLYEPIRFDLATQVWVGASKSEWEAAHPEPVPVPTPQQTLMAGVMKDLAGVKNDGKDQGQLNAQLLKDVAGIKTQLSNLQGQVEETKAQATAALTNTQASTPTSQPTQPSTVTGPAQPTTASGFAQPVQSTQPTQPKED